MGDWCQLKDIGDLFQNRRHVLSTGDGNRLTMIPEQLKKRLDALLGFLGRAYTFLESRTLVILIWVLSVLQKIALVVSNSFVASFRSLRPMPIPNLNPGSVDNASYQIHRPFGAASARSSGTGSLVDSLPCGRSPGGSNLLYTHVLYVGSSEDVRDGCSRTAGGDAILYADGDEVRVTTPFGYTRFAVVWVGSAYDKGSISDPSLGGIPVYLLRHENVHV